MLPFIRQGWGGFVPSLGHLWGTSVVFETSSQAPIMIPVALSLG